MTRQPLAWTVITTLVLMLSLAPPEAFRALAQPGDTVTFVNDTGRKVGIQISGSDLEVGGRKHMLIKPRESAPLRVAPGRQRLRVAELEPLLGFLPMATKKDASFEKWIDVQPGAAIRITEIDFRPPVRPAQPPERAGSSPVGAARGQEESGSPTPRPVPPTESSQVRHGGQEQHAGQPTVPSVAPVGAQFWWSAGGNRVDSHFVCGDTRAWNVVGDVPRSVDFRGDDDTAKQYLRRGAEWALVQCAESIQRLKDEAFRRAVGWSAKFNVSIRHQPLTPCPTGLHERICSANYHLVVVTGEFSFGIDERGVMSPLTFISQSFKNWATERWLPRAEDGEIISNAEKSLGDRAQYRVQADNPRYCERDQPEFAVDVEVPPGIDLTNERVARAYAATGLEFAARQCPKMVIDVPRRSHPSWVVSVRLSQGGQGVGSAVWRGWKSEFALASLGRTGISRTIEGFALGMHFTEAMEQVLGRLGRGELTWQGGVAPSRDAILDAFSNTTWVPPAGGQVEIAISPALASPTATRINLMFFEGRLFEIFVLPLASQEVTQKALRDKYGVAMKMIRGRHGQFSTSYEWSDPKTTLIFNADAFSGSGLEYRDLELLAAMKRRSEEIQRSREEREKEEQRRRSILPRGY